MTVGPSWTYSTPQAYWAAVERATRRPRVDYGAPLGGCLYTNCGWPTCGCPREAPASCVMPWYVYDV